MKFKKTALQDDMYAPHFGTGVMYVGFHDTNIRTWLTDATSFAGFKQPREFGRVSAASDFLLHEGASHDIKHCIVNARYTYEKNQKQQK